MITADRLFWVGVAWAAICGLGFALTALIALRLRRRQRYTAPPPVEGIDCDLCGRFVPINAIEIVERTQSTVCHDCWVEEEPWHL